MKCAKPASIPTTRHLVLALTAAAALTSVGVEAAEPPTLEPPRDRNASQTENVDAEQISLHVRGSFEIRAGEHPFMRGQGSTTIQLNPLMAEKLSLIIGQQMQTAETDGESVLAMLQSLSKTLESTSEILKSLSDPKTQEALRQTQQLLELLPKSEP